MRTIQYHSILEWSRRIHQNTDVQETYIVHRTRLFVFACVLCDRSVLRTYQFYPFFFYLNDIPFQLFFFFSHFVPSLLFTPRPIPIAISSLDWSPLCVCASWFCVPKSRCHSHILPICACDSHGRWKEWDGRRVGGGHHICR